MLAYCYNSVLNPILLLLIDFFLYFYNYYVAFCTFLCYYLIQPNKPQLCFFILFCNYFISSAAHFFLTISLLLPFVFSQLPYPYYSQLSHETILSSLYFLYLSFSVALSRTAGKNSARRICDYSESCKWLGHRIA